MPARSGVPKAPCLPDDHHARPPARPTPRHRSPAACARAWGSTAAGRMQVRSTGWLAL